MLWKVWTEGRLIDIWIVKVAAFFDISIHEIDVRGMNLPGWALEAWEHSLLLNFDFKIQPYVI